MVTSPGSATGPAGVVVFSTGTTSIPVVSATGAPVMMRTACPAGTSVGAAPAGTSPATGRVHGPGEGRAAAWTRKPSIAELAWGGTGKRAVASAARTRLMREASTAADSAGRGDARVRTASRCAEMLRGVDIKIRLAADGRHRTVRLQKAFVIDAMARLFAPHFPSPGLHDLLIAGPRAQ